MLASSAPARQRVGPLLGLPAVGPVRIVRNAPLAVGDVVLGRADLRADWASDERGRPELCTALVAVGFADPVDVSALVAFRHASRMDCIEVTALSAAERPDADERDTFGVRHVGWQVVARGLVEAGDPDSDALLSLLAEAGLGARGPRSAVRL